MRIVSSRLSGRAWLFLLLGFPLFVLAAPKQVDAYTLSGKVTDVSLTGIEDATVSVKDSGTSTEVGNATTDSSGNYSVSVASGTYDIEVTPPVGNTSTPSKASEYQVTGNVVIDFFLASAGSAVLSGHLYDAEGTPLASQRLRLNNGSDYTTTTDASGNYLLEVPSGATYALFINEPTGQNSLSVHAPQQYTLRDMAIPLTTESKVLDMALPVKKVTIHVQDVSSNPVSGAQVNAPFDTANNQGLTLGDLTNVTGLNGYPSGPVTNASGNVDLWLFPNNSTYSYSFTAIPPIGSEYVATTLSGIVVTGDTTQVLTLQKPVVLSGHLYDALGNPLPDQRVKLKQPNGFSTESITNASGEYSLNVFTSQYELVIDPTTQNSALNIPQQYMLRDGMITLSGDRTLDITLPLKEVTVHVQSQTGDPVSDVKVNVPYDTVNNQGLTLGDVTNVTALDGYSSGPLTDVSGNATLWLFPNNGSYTYAFVAKPPVESIYQDTTLSNVAITSDQTVTISLEYVHDAPVTTATLSPPADGQGNYSDPTTVTLSATAASGYSVANTYYTVDGGSQQTYSSPFVISGTGSHTLTFWSVDNIGIPETENVLNFDIVPLRQLTSLDPAKVWVGLKNTTDVGLRFDLKAEVYKDGVLVASGQVDSVDGGDAGFNNAVQSTIPFNTFSPVTFPVGSSLSMKVSVRNACTGSTVASGKARLWFDSNNADSQFGAVFNTMSSDYYLSDAFALITSPGPGPKQHIDSNAGAQCSNFKTFGTWAITL